MILVDDILRQLPNLSNEELVRVSSACKALGSLPSDGEVRSAPTVGVDSDVTLVLDALVSFLNDKGLEFSSRKQLSSSRMFKSFSAKVPAVMVYARSVARSRNSLRAFFRLSFALLYEDILTMNVAVSSVTLMSHVHRIPAVINKAFPGYAQAGVLNWITRKKKG